MKRPALPAAGVLILCAAALAALLAPWLSPHDPNARHANLLNAPPTRVYMVGWQALIIYPWIRISQLEQRYEEDRSRPVAIDWFAGGRLAQSSDEAGAPLLLLGADSFGRDVFARVLYGARTSLALALAAAIGATLLGSPMLQALRTRDVYLVAGCAGAGALFLACGTLLSDLALAAVDPRASEARAEAS